MQDLRSMVGEYHRVGSGSDGFLFSVVSTLLFRGQRACIFSIQFAFSSLYVSLLLICWPFFIDSGDFA